MAGSRARTRSGRSATRDVALAWPSGSDDAPVAPVEPADGGVGLTYRVEPSGAAERAGQVLRERLAAAGVEGADVTVSADATLTVTAPAGARAAVMRLAQPGHFAFYGREAGVLGPRGEPAPADPSVTAGLRSPAT